MYMYYMLAPWTKEETTKRQESPTQTVHVGLAKISKQGKADADVNKPDNADVSQADKPGADVSKPDNADVSKPDKPDADVSKPDNADVSKPDKPDADVSKPDNADVSKPDKPVADVNKTDKPDAVFSKLGEYDANNVFLLALDGDVDFEPDALQKLVDLLKRDPLVGAACGRIHPVGTGKLLFKSSLDIHLKKLDIWTGNLKGLCTGHICNFM